ncbi:EF-hand domain-containing protein [Thermomonas paludicola]|uniref:EF-hand domain-containing protein n=1 Tax=Thermomonas paludicola TaxID=2884874 RepID=UPI002114C7BD|nr:EF-hand domain-containing protein [Thermomonas paludicola]
MMKKMLLLTLAVSAALTSALAIAQSAAQKPGNPDANGDGVITKAEAAAFPRLAGKFDQLDADKDGKLSGDELPMRHAGMHQGEGMRKHGWMKDLDTDHDGRISKAEAQAGKGDFAQRFEQMDVNKDGYVDRADMQARMASKRAECFAKADADKNGQLSRAEFDKMGDACGMHRGGMGDRRPGNGGNPGPLPPKK